MTAPCPISRRSGSFSAAATKTAHTGQITMEQMHIYRHQTGLRDVGISITPEQALLACLREISEQDA